MIKLILFLLIAFFIAEIILAFSAIINIVKFDRAINKLNNLILVKNGSIQYYFADLRAIFKDFTNWISDLKELIKQKKTLYLYNVLKTVIIYLGIFSLKGKYKKAAIAIQFAKEVYEGINEI